LAPTTQRKKAVTEGSALRPERARSVAQDNEVEGKAMRVRILTVLAAVCTLLAITTNAQAIKGGVPDANQHPYVGQLLFYLPDEVDPAVHRSRRLVQLHRHPGEPDDGRDPGHCTFGTGLNG